MPETYDYVPLDDTFARNYEIEWLVDMPNSVTSPRYFLEGTSHSDGSGPILRVSAEGRRRIIVVGGTLAQLRLLTWPNPWCFFAMPSNKLVDVRRPESAAHLEGLHKWVAPGFIAVKERRLMLVYRIDVIDCYGIDGLLWTTKLYMIETLRDRCYCKRELERDNAEARVDADYLALDTHTHDEAGNEMPMPIYLSLATGECANRT